MSRGWWRETRTFSNLFVVHYTLTHTMYCLLLTVSTFYSVHIPCLVAIVDITHVNNLSTKNELPIPYVVAIVDCTHWWLATGSLKELVTVAHENSSNKQLNDLVTVSKEWVVHKPNSRIEYALPNSNSGRYRQYSKHAGMSIFNSQYLPLFTIFGFTGSRNGLDRDMH